MPPNKLKPSQLAALPKTFETIVPESYLDDMGHMNVMWYTHLFSQGTIGLFQLMGLTDDYFRAGRGGAFALEAHTRYLSEIRVGTRVSVRSRILGRSDVRFHHMHFLVNEDAARVSATNEIIGAHIDMRVRRMSPLPTDIAQAIDALVAEHNQLGWDPPLVGTMTP